MTPAAPDPVEPHAAPLDRRKSVVLGVIGAGTLVIIFARVIPQVGSYADAVAAIKAMTAGAITLIVVSVIGYLAAYGLPFLAATPGLSYWRSQQLNQAAFAVGNGLPAGGAFGVGVQYAMLASYGVDPTASTAAIASVGVWSVFVTLGMPVLGVAAVELSGQSSGSYLVPATIGLLVLLAGIAVFILIIRSQRTAERLGSLATRLVGPLTRKLRKGKQVDFVPLLVEFRLSIVDLVRRRWAAITASQVGVAFTQFLILYMSLRGVEGWGAAGTPILVAFGAFAIAQLGLMIPITPGGLGTVDAAMIALMTSMGVPSGEATAADLVWRAASFLPQIIIGVVALVTWSRRAAHTFASGKAAQ